MLKNYFTNILKIIVFLFGSIKISRIFVKEITTKTNIMTTQTLNIETATKSEIIIAASIQKDLMIFLGGLVMIKERSEEALKSLLKMYFSLNTEVGVCYNKNGF